MAKKIKVLGQLGYSFYLAILFPKIDDYHACHQFTVEVDTRLWDADVCWSFYMECLNAEKKLSHIFKAVQNHHLHKYFLIKINFSCSLNLRTPTELQLTKIFIAGT